ncbi:MAG: hypothetical protein H6622_15120 [Halobacteriovoraceae bacterium]|nr:hypothetical protein [Halobacteriovoraceae bacterium]
MRLIVSGLICYFAFCLNLFGNEFDREHERKKMLLMINTNQVSQIRVADNKRLNPQKRKFVEFYTQQFLPFIAQMNLVEENAGFFHVALDRALYNDLDEKELWQNKKLTLEKKYNELSSSNQYKDLLRKGYKLSQGLIGPIVKQVIDLYEWDKIYGTTSNDLAIINELTSLAEKINDIANMSPVKKEIGSTLKLITEVERKFRDNEISLDTALREVELLDSSSYNAYGNYILEKARIFLDRQAILRTELAQRKGFPNWAAYQIAKNERYYAEGYKTIEDRIIFLKKFLQETKPAFLETIRVIAKENKLKRDQLAKLTFEFLLPNSEIQMQDFFPKSKVLERWKDSMIKSGFKSDVLDNIIIDSFPRENKFGHAYMAAIKTSKPKITTVDSKTLSIKDPYYNWNNWSRPAIYVVQNIRNDGRQGHRTVWHEGGHGLDYSSRRSVYGEKQDSAYAETHSMMMEKELLDHDFLINTMSNEQGEFPSTSLIKDYINDFKIRTFWMDRYQYLNALYDIEIWNYPYTEGGMSYTDRSDQILQEYTSKFFYDFPRKTSKYSISAQKFITNHFYGGEVRYIGYLYAEVAAVMSNERLLDLLEEKTGRRTWYDQPQIADILIYGIYRKGHIEKFPHAIENFTLSPYSTDLKLKLDLEVIESFIQSKKAQTLKCEELMQVLKKK